MTALVEDPKVTKSYPSRRTLLAGALGGLGAWAATAVGRAVPVRANDPNDVVLGTTNTATTTTTISNNANANTAVSGVNYGAGIGVAGTSNAYNGVHGSSSSGYGVFGISSAAAGVSAYSSASNGVEARSNSSSASAVYGQNDAKGYGVAGRSNSPGLGVDGIYAAACLGENTAGGIGVWARSQAGVALYADAIDQTSAIALKTRGITQFSRSGTLTILAGHTSVTKSAIRIDSGALVLAVLQQDRNGIHVRSAVPNVSGDSFTIHLNKAVSGDTKVGWFIVN
jgi:hypothetical protein